MKATGADSGSGPEADDSADDSSDNSSDNSSDSLDSRQEEETTSVNRPPSEDVTAGEETGGASESVDEATRLLDGHELVALFKTLHTGKTYQEGVTTIGLVRRARGTTGYGREQQGSHGVQEGTRGLGQDSD